MLVAGGLEQTRVDAFSGMSQKEEICTAPQFHGFPYGLYQGVNARSQLWQGDTLHWVVSPALILLLILRKGCHVRPWILSCPKSPSASGSQVAEMTGPCHQSGDTPLLFLSETQPNSKALHVPNALIFRSHPQGAPWGNLVKSLSLQSLRKLNSFPKITYYLSDKY